MASGSTQERAHRRSTAVRLLILYNYGVLRLRYMVNQRVSKIGNRSFM